MSTLKSLDFEHQPFDVLAGKRGEFKTGLKPLHLSNFPG